MRKIFESIILAAILVFLFVSGASADSKTATVKGTSHEIMLMEASTTMGGTPIQFLFTTYDNNRYSLPYYFDSDPGMLYFSRELKKAGSYYKADYYSLVNSNTINDYGELSLNLGYIDSDGNGIDDICEKTKAFNTSVSGNWYSQSNASGTITGTMARTANSQQGSYNISINNTWAGNIPFSGSFYVGTLDGTVTYSHANKTITLDHAVTFEHAYAGEQLNTTFEIVSRDSVRILATGDFPTTVFTRAGNSYSATVVLIDGNTSTFWPDYQKWKLVIQDTNDSDMDGVPDLSDACPSDANNDADGDGVCGDVDGCPADSNKTVAGICGCGVADTDSDGDGTANCNDGCPVNPTKTSPGYGGCDAYDTSVTPADTVTVSPMPGVSVTLQNVSEACTLATSFTGVFTPLQYRKVGYAYEVKTDCDMTLATVCLNYAETDVLENESLLELHHLNGNYWENITTSLDMAGNTVCGDVSTFSPFVVVEPPFAPTPVHQTIGGGYGHSMAVKNDGTLWSWGANDYGQLGDGTTKTKSTPSQVMSGVHAIAAGNSHSLAVKSDGTLWAWGYNVYGQLGNGTTVNRSTPVQVLTGVKVIAAGYTHSLALKSDGTLWSWGNNGSGQLGDGTYTTRFKPVQVLTGVQTVAAGSSHTLALKNDGTLWACGYNEYGQLGDGSATNRSAPVQVLAGVQAVAAGYYHTLALKNDGTLWGWGRNDFGQLGDGTTTNRSTPVQILTNVQAVAAGSFHTLALKNDGTLWVWGYNNYGQLGNGSTENRTTPVQVLTGVQVVAAGQNHSQALKIDGTLWTWGQNVYGQLGNGSITTNKELIPKSSLTDFQAVAAGSLHTLALKIDGTLWACGGNTSGQLGDGTTTNRSSPVQILINVQAIATSDSHSLAVKSDGTLWAWGTNWSGQLGDGTVLTRLEPVQVLSNVQAVAVGSGHTLALKNDGTLWAWGYNTDGQLGDGSTINRSTPVQVLTGVHAIASGKNHSLALKSDGTLWVWGSNYSGQLGDGSSTSKSTPVQILTNVQAIAAGSSHTLAVKNDATLWTWGRNMDGQLGNGTTIDRPTPVQVMTGVQAIAGGNWHTLAVKKDGTLWAWGSNYFGQLGDATTTSRSIPVQVLTDAQTVSAGYFHSLAVKSDATLWVWGDNRYGQLGNAVLVPSQSLFSMFPIDSDNDGTPDSSDGCPADPNKTVAGQCGCGVADTDSDNDGTADCNDSCPADPNKIAAGFCGCGTAETDNDSDGTPNCVDLCPNDADKTAAGTCGCGVADSDTDLDGVVDCIDNCPQDANPDQSDFDGDGAGDICDLDEDNDGAPAAVEDAAPNSGDANNDGTPDSDQDNVASLLSAASGNYITVDTITAGGGSVLADVAAIDTTQLPADPQYNLPYGLVGFTVLNPGNLGFSETVRLYFHGVANLTGYVYRKFDPNTSTWYTLPDVVFGVEEIGGQTVAYADLPLTDGGVGDSDHAVNSAIVDPGGPALAKTSIHVTPQISATVSTDTDRVVMFDASQSSCYAMVGSVSEGRVCAYEWNLGGPGKIVGGQGDSIVVFQYDTAGDYTATLTLTETGSQEQGTASVTVRAADVEPQVPVADFATAVSGREVTLSAPALPVEVTRAYIYWGDRTRTLATNPHTDLSGGITHTYTLGGRSYNIRIMTIDGAYNKVHYTSGEDPDLTVAVP